MSCDTPSLTAPRYKSADLLVAVDIGGTKTAVNASTASGLTLTTHRFPTLGSDEDGRAAFAYVMQVAAEVIRDVGGGQRAFVGLVCPGHVTRDGIVMSPNLPGVENFDLRAAIAEALPGHTVVVANDVRAAALAELRTGALQNADPGMYLNLGTGVFAALTVGGQVLAGAHGYAGEIGYARSFGDHKTLEDRIGGPALVAEAERLLADGRALTASGVLTSSDPRLRRLVDDATRYLGECLAHLVLAVDPVRIALGGGLMAASEVVLNALRQHLSEFGAGSVELVAADHVHDAALRGAVELAAHARRGEFPSWTVVS